MTVGEKKGNGRGEKREDEREKAEEGEGRNEKKSETGRPSKLLGPQGTCVVSYRA